MRDETRREDILKRTIAAEKRAAEYLKDAKPEIVKLFETATNGISATRTFFLATKLASPETREGWWLDMADENLKNSTEWFIRLSQQVDRFDGPSKAEIIG